MNSLEVYHHPSESKQPRVLLYDIENSSIQVETWRIWQSDAIRVTREWYILSVAWKWLGEKKVHCLTLADFKTFKKDFRDDSELVKAFYPIFDEADILIAHNGNKHDQRKMNARFIYHGLNPPSPYQQIDTYLVAKRKFAFTSNRLHDLDLYLGGTGKLDCPPQVWDDCMHGKAQAFKQMAKYNKHDVNRLEYVYKKMAAWDNRHPFIGASGRRRKSFAEIDGAVCTRCGSERLSSKGWKETAASYYRQYECLDCGGYSQSPVRVAKKTKDLRSL